ncbi:hypothetical protein, partial [Chlorogloeopsis fritschii]|uniref:hypothetical protein n=1 Tax=Chlorogloeopsis fritschii TaxID=1124 RepID=UPI0023F53190
IIFWAIFIGFFLTFNTSAYRGYYINQLGYYSQHLYQLLRTKNNYSKFHQHGIVCVGNATTILTTKAHMHGEFWF